MSSGVPIAFASHVEKTGRVNTGVVAFFSSLSSSFSDLSLKLSRRDIWLWKQIITSIIIDLSWSAERYHCET